MLRYLCMTGFLVLPVRFTVAQCVVTPVSASLASVTHAKCYGDNSGVATVSATGGSGQYTYSWNTSPSQHTATASGLFAGTYSVVVMDQSGGCVTSGSELLVNGDFESGNTGFTSGHVYCSAANCLSTLGENSYSVGTTPSFYHPAFVGNDHTTGSGNFMIINAAITSGIPVWCQTVAVTPNTNYVFSGWVSSVVASSPAQLQVTFNGTPAGSSHTAPSTTYTWSQFCVPWNSGSLTSVNICIYNLNTAASGNDLGIDDLSMKSCSGTSFPSDTVTVTINEPAKLVTTLPQINLNCYEDTVSVTANTTGGTPPYMHLWVPSFATGTTQHGMGPGIYYVQTQDDNFCTVDDTLIIGSPPALIPLISNVQHIDCYGDSTGTATVTGSGGTPGYNYFWQTMGSTGSIASGLYAGTHQVTITDDAGCSKDTSIIINSPDSLYLTVTGDFEICADETALATAQAYGGVSPYTIHWPDGSSGMNDVLPAGTHIVNVTDANGCSVSQQILVGSPNPVTASFDYTAPADPGSSSPYTFHNQSTNEISWHWDFGDGTSSGSENPDHVYGTAGSYIVILTVTGSDGCTDTAMREIVFVQEFVIIPNVFSPNNDGKNDSFTVRHGGFTSFSLVIYNRWGVRVYEGNGTPGWDGKISGNADAAEGTYYFVLSGERPQGDVYRHAGYLTLFR